MSELIDAGPGIGSGTGPHTGEGGGTPEPAVTVQLFVASNSALSVMALTNLRRALATIPDETRPHVQVVDVLHDPAVAVRHHVYVTPTLVLTASDRGGAPLRSTMIGDLSDAPRVIASLDGLLGRLAADAAAHAPTGA